MTLRIATSSSIEPWYEAWIRLWHRETASPFLHPGWHLAFLSAWSDRIEPLLICVLDDETLVGMLPLRRDSDGVLRFLTAPRSDYEDALAPGPAGEAIVSLLSKFLCRERFSLVEVPEQSLLATSLRDSGLMPIGSGACPGINLSEDVLKTLTAKSSIRRHYRKLSRRGPVELRDVGQDDVVAALDNLIEQHVARRLAADDDSLFLDERNRSFYRSLVTRNDFPEFGRFHVLRVGDVDAAYHVGLANRESFIWYKPTFDLNIASDGPGEVLLKSLLEHASASGASYFDFSRGTAAFKSRFSNELKRNLRFARRLPVLPRVVRKLTRPFRSKGLSAMARESRVQKLGLDRSSGPVMLVRAPGQQPVPPDGVTYEFGEVDLVGFGALRIHIPDYVNTERMRLAQERHQRGDRILIVRRSSDRRPMHVAWLHVPSAGCAAVGDRPMSQPDRPGAEIQDVWAAAEPKDAPVHTWATLFLAWQAAGLGMPVYVCRSAARHLAAESSDHDLLLTPAKSRSSTAVS